MTRVLSELFRRHTTRYVSMTSSLNNISSFPRYLLLPRTRFSQDHSFREIDGHEIASPEELTMLRWIRLAPSKTGATTDPLDHRTFMESIMPQAYPYVKCAATLIPTQVVTEINRNHSNNQEHNPSRYEEISTCKSCGYRNPHDLHHQYDSQSIYTLRLGWRWDDEQPVQ